MKTFTGIVKSIKMPKTVVIRVESRRQHPVYHKQIKSTKNYKVHNENLEVKIGDLVSFVETKPISKDKKWKLEKIIKI